MNEQTWRKSSFSGNENACTELSVGGQRTRVRDSKAPQVGTLTFTGEAFQSFLDVVKGGETNR